MADDSMDWHPTTPPAPHNPYSHPQYMPGGWPMSPPPFRYGTGVFARKRSAPLISRAAKKICTGIHTLGTYAALPAKPVFIIVRNWRNRRRERRNRAQNTAQLTHTPAILPTYTPTEEQNKDTVEEGVRLTAQQIATPPSTPPPSHNLSILSQQTVAGQLYIQSPVATSVTDTETQLGSPATLLIQSQSPSIIDRKSAKRKRDASIDSRTQDDHHYSTISQYLAAVAAAQEQKPTDGSPQFKRMRGGNPFSEGYKQSLTAYGGRGAPSFTPLRSIGTKLDGTEQSAGVWGSWQHERPIEPNQFILPLQSTSTQTEPLSPVSLQDDLSVESSVEVENLPASETAIGQAAPVSEELAFDERWSVHQPSTVFDAAQDLLDDLEYEESEAEELVPATPKPELPADTFGSTLKRLFYEQKFTLPPPPFKNRPVAPELDLKQAAPGSGPVTINSTSTPPDSLSCEITKEKSEVSDPVPGETVLTSDKNKPASTDGKVSDSDVDNTTVDQLKTPVKALGKEPAKHQLQTPANSLAQKVPETPADKLSNLKLDDDDDTPKATPHSGTKTTRITRYREAYEKAQKAKLEQYELVELSKDWTKKVQQAVRNGIPDYLSATDLARVAPQFARQGQDNWLNDETINKYLELVSLHGRKNDRPEQVRSHHAFNNFFYNNLKSKGAKSILGWSKRAKIGGKNLAYVEKIFVPINSGMHWTLAVVEPVEKRITHYNSLGGAGTGIRACEDLKNWVALELGKDFKEDEWTLTAVGESPQQNNSDDCGVFTITSARQVMLGYTPMSYTKDDIPNQRVRIVAELINRGLLRSSDPK